MTTRTVSVASTVGLHARPAALFVKEVSESGISVTITKVGGGKTVNAASLLAVMSLGVKHNEEVELASDADGADEILNRLVAFLQIDHDAEG
ncbi:MAG: HPr family phosphocarrier protein [Propionibacteriaceae bacterium]|nr:HPr family phosphocarrier protein [Propionibacteriaceae bacterium]